MKKTPVSGQNKQTKQSATSGSIPSSVAPGTDAAQSEGEDPTAGLQTDLDRFRDLALRITRNVPRAKRKRRSNMPTAPYWSVWLELLTTLSLVSRQQKSRARTLLSIPEWFSSKNSLVICSLKVDSNRSRLKGKRSTQTCTKQSLMSRVINFPKEL